MVHWAQYMDIFDNSDQIGLIDFNGNVRPAWWAFRWWADIPVERVVGTSSTCASGVALVWTSLVCLRVASVDDAEQVTGINRILLASCSQHAITA